MARKRKTSGKYVGVPPVEHRFKPGQSGCPGGNRTAGAYLSEWLNAMSQKTQAQLERILHDKRAPMLKRSAAERILRTVMPQLSSYEGLVSGSDTLAKLEKEGVDTAVVKKLKERQQLDADGCVVAITREIELHNLAGEEFDRIANRTDGKPNQRVTVDAKVDVHPDPVILVHTAPPAPSEAK